VITIGEDPSGATHDSVHGASDARADCHHPTAERLTIVSFDDQVRVISLE
jgi:hypothetical protein